MTDPRPARIQRLTIQINDLGKARHLSERQGKLLASLKRERQQLQDAIELDRRQRPLFPDDGGRAA